MQSKVNQQMAESAAVILSNEFAALDDMSEFPKVIGEVLNDYLLIDWLTFNLSFQEFKAKLQSTISLTYNFEHADAYWKLYKEELGYFDPGLEALMKAPIGAGFQFNEIHDPANEIHQWVYDIANRFTGVEDAYIIKLLDDKEMVAILSLYRNDIYKPFTKDEILFFQRLTPIFQACTKTMMLQWKSEVMVESAQELLNESAAMSVLFDDRMNPLFVAKSLQEQLKPFFKSLRKDNSARILPEEILNWLRDEVYKRGKLDWKHGSWSYNHLTSHGKVKCTATVLTNGLIAPPTLLLKFTIQSDRNPFLSLKKLGLSAKEIDTLAYLPLGYTNEQIAIASGVSKDGIKKRLTKIGEKLGVSGRTQILFEAIELSKAIR